MTARLPFAAAALFLLTAAQAFGQASEHAGPASHTLEFIENKGQWTARSRYEAQLPGGRLFAETDGLTFSLLADGGPARHAHGAAKATPPPADSTVRGHALKLRFEGAAPARVTAETPTAERRNYFLGGDARRWTHDVRSYRELHYAGLWPGVSARVYESADQHLEYDFVLAPGARPGAIALRHDGADGLRLDAAGNLLVQTSVGTLTERAPQAWQADAAGRHQPVACRYVLTGGTVHFALGKYDAARPVTIDPVVVFSSYTGATADNWGFTATYDVQGNLYSGGIVFGQGYPTSFGAYRTTFAGQFDIGIIKYNTAVTGSAARVWATYIGGSGADFPHSLVVNSQGELLILGTTSSAGAVGSTTAFPTTTGALQRTFAGGTPASPFGFSYSALYNVTTGSDLVIAKLNATGTALVSSTYLGGSGNDGLLPLDPNVSAFSTTPQLAHNYGDPFRGDIQVDAANNVYIATHTTSTNFPMARGFNSNYRGGTSDGVVCKFTPDLTALTWGSYLGGTGSDGAFSIQIEPTSGDVYVAGGTLSPNFPTTTGAYRTTRPGDVDGFVTRIAANGTSILRSSFVGTVDYDQAFFLQLGSDGGVYLLGQTGGAFPVTPGVYNTRFGTQFIQKLDANLGQSLLSTVFGSTAASNIGFINIDPTAFLVDQCDRVYVCGWGGNENAQGYPYMDYNGTTVGMPITPGAAQTTTDGSDFYLAQFSAGLTNLAYGTYYGDTTPNSAGEHVDGGTSRFDPRGIVYQAVCSCFSTNGFPIPPGANYYSATNNSVSNISFNVSCNNASFVLNFQPSIANAGSDQGVCATAGPLALVGSPAGGVWSGPGVTGSIGNFVFTPSAALVGVQTLTYTVLSTGACTTTGVRRVTVTAPPTVTLNSVPQSSYCLPTPGAPAYGLVPLSATPAGGTFSGPGVSGSVATGFTFSPNIAAGTYQLTYTLNVNGCVVTATQPVSIVSAANAGVPQTVCATAGPLALVGSPTGGTWTGPGVTGNVASGFVFTPSAALVGANTLTYTVGGTCSGNRVVTVAAPPVVVFNPLPQATYCLPVAGGQGLPAVPLTGTPAGGTFSGPGVSGSSGTGFAFSPNLAAGTYQLTYTVVANGCTVQATQAVTLVNAPAPTLPADTVLCPGSSQAFRLRGSPAGGMFSGTGVSGSVATGFFFTPPASFPGAITVTYSFSNSSGCTGSATRRISVATVPQLGPTWAPVACPETRLTPLALRFTLAGTGLPSSSFSVAWDFGDGTQSTEANPTHTYAAAGSYRPTLRVRYNGGNCETQVALPLVEAQERKIPNIITPNGDGQNQFFRLGPDCPPRLQIFSRWGQQVLDAPAYRDDWKAEGHPDGVYYYLLTYPDGHRLKGWVEVVR